MDPLTGNVTRRFFSYAVPTVLGMLAMSSAGIVDGMFLGNFVGANAIAAVNIVLPVFSLMMGLTLMVNVGSTVIAGELLGRNESQAASRIFSQTLVLVTLLAVIFVTAIMFALEPVIRLLGANEQLVGITAQYLRIIMLSMPAYMLGICLYYFVRLDGRPKLASVALLVSALVNIVLDALLVGWLQWGIEGAAYATAASYVILAAVLVMHFIAGKGQLRWCSPMGGWRRTIAASGNGLSEFVNELSVGATTLIFNWVMVERFGTQGVAAFAVVNYIVWISMMILFGVSDSLPPMMSKNFGAGRIDRVRSLLRVGLVTVSTIGVLVIVVLLIVPEALVDIFLKDDAVTTRQIALEFIHWYWPAFLFSGAAICISAYLTALQKPLPSAAIAISRSFILPCVFVATLPLVWGNTGVFLAIPLAEACTFILAIVLMMRISSTVR
ncbi:Multidrug export protein MepA [BD1-7 clade bacterium]|uniref:Multidrug export protein MepA n=1 Tax=BD1-7 clade bacterium TaxID=2029982 RepID=A0A5S9N3G6_9GAMM|nr:Multidrug export protein MepA [BD1-7 clade bacterium]